MIKKILNHVKEHEKSYNIGFIVLLFLIVGVLFSKTVTFTEISGELTGDISTAAKRKTRMEVLSPQPGDIFAVEEPITIEWQYQEGFLPEGHPGYEAYPMLIGSQGYIDGLCQPALGSCVWANADGLEGDFAIFVKESIDPWVNRAPSSSERHLVTFKITDDELSQEYKDAYKYRQMFEYLKSFLNLSRSSSRAIFVFPQGGTYGTGDAIKIAWGFPSMGSTFNWPRGTVHLLTADEYDVVAEIIKDFDGYITEWEVPEGVDGEFRFRLKTRRGSVSNTAYSEPFTIISSVTEEGAVVEIPAGEEVPEEDTEEDEEEVIEEEAEPSGGLLQFLENLRSIRNR